jgi:hypothetical protein
MRNFHFKDQKNVGNLNLIVICFVLLTTSLKAQFQNGSFENWDAGDPIFWTTSQFDYPGSASQNTDAHSGSFSVKLKVVNDNLGLVATPYVFNLFSLTTMPQVLTFWTKGSLAANNQLKMAYSLNQNDSSYALLAFGNKLVTNVSNVYQLQTVNIIPLAGPSLLGLANVYFSIDPMPGFSNDTSSFVLIDEVNLNAGSTGFGLFETETAVLENVYPNPSQDFAWLKFKVAQAATVRIVLYDVLGNEVQQCFNQSMSAGIFKTAINTSTLSSGVYLCKLMLNEKSYTTRLVKR